MENLKLARSHNTNIYHFPHFFYSETESCPCPPSRGHGEWQHELHGSYDGDDAITAGSGRSPPPALSPSPAHAGPAPRIPTPYPPPPQPCTECPSPPTKPRAPQLPPAPPTPCTRTSDLSTPTHALCCFTGIELEWDSALRLYCCKFGEYIWCEDWWVKLNLTFRVYLSWDKFREWNIRKKS